MFSCCEFWAQQELASQQECFSWDVGAIVLVDRRLFGMVIDEFAEFRWSILTSLASVC